MTRLKDIDMKWQKRTHNDQLQTKIYWHWNECSPLLKDGVVSLETISCGSEFHLKWNLERTNFDIAESDIGWAQVLCYAQICWDKAAAWTEWGHWDRMLSRLQSYIGCKVLHGFSLFAEMADGLLPANEYNWHPSILYIISGQIFKNFLSDQCLFWERDPKLELRTQGAVLWMTSTVKHSVWGGTLRKRSIEDSY